MNSRLIKKLKGVGAFFLVLLVPVCVHGEPASFTDTVPIFFIGENVDMLCIASKKEESAWDAPAIASVISRSDIREKGFLTLSEALSESPGFYMAAKEWGSMSYQRGIAGSTLFLYDTVALGSEISKSFSSLDENLSLAPVKRIEIINGPGSVLWGPDAFAGIVNIVPLTGRDFHGVESGLSTGFNDQSYGAYLNAGGGVGEIDGFLSVTASRWDNYDDRAANIIRFWGDGDTPVSPLERRGSEKPKGGEYIDVTGNVSLGTSSLVSMRISDYSKSYSRSDQGLSDIWNERRDVYSGQVRFESNIKYGYDTVFRFGSGYSWINPEIRVIDLSIPQKEATFQSELAVDRSVLDKKGLLTAGVSYRYKNIKDAPVWDGYFPEYFNEVNLPFLPGVTTVDTDSKMWSFFGQYRHTFGNFSVWTGLRRDIHDIYGNPPSLNTGLSWAPDSDWMFKLIYGTANRTPSARQLTEDGYPDMENIRNLSLNMSFRHGTSFKGGMTCFLTNIENHILEDPNIGASEPNRQKLWGAEFDFSLALNDFNDLMFSSAWMQNSGPSEVYKYNDYSYMDGGELVKHYVDLAYPYDLGSSLQMSAGWKLKISDKASVYTSVNHFIQQDVVYPLGQISQKYDSPWLLNVCLNADDFLFDGLSLYTGVKNALDNNYKVPGVYGTIDGRGAAYFAGIRMKWN